MPNKIIRVFTCIWFMKTRALSYDSYSVMGKNCFILIVSAEASTILFVGGEKLTRRNRNHTYKDKTNRGFQK